MIEPQLTIPEGVEYDDEAHRYLLDGEPVPSVSRVLEVIEPDRYTGISEDIMQRAAERGKNAHAMVALDVRGQLDLTSLDERLSDNYIAWQNFCDDFQFECEMSERIVASRRHKVCGTIDLAGSLVYKGRRVKAMPDLKFTAAQPDIVDLQTAGYEILSQETFPGWERLRCCLWIFGDRYKFMTYTNPSDRAVFLAGLAVLNRRERR